MERSAVPIDYIMNSNDEEETFYDCRETAAEVLKTAKNAEIKYTDCNATEENVNSDIIPAAQSSDDSNTNADSDEKFQIEQDNEEREQDNDENNCDTKNIERNDIEINATSIPQASSEDNESSDQSDSESLTDSEIEVCLY